MVDKDEMGEGNYKASREFDKEQAAFVAENKDEIEAAARDAEQALDGPEAAELEAAEKEAKSHAKG
jgi:hypothetical protein